MLEVYAAYPRGMYLADGAYKDVYKVFCPNTRNYSIFTVMDISAIRETGNEVYTLMTCTFISAHIDSGLCSTLSSKKLHIHC